MAEIEVRVYAMDCEPQSGEHGAAKSSGGVRDSSQFVVVLVSLQPCRAPRDQLQTLPETTTPVSLRFNPARVQLWATVDLPRSAFRTLHVLADLGHRHVRRQRYGRWINIAFAVAFPAIKPEELAVAD
jgi:hypothetical protein